MPLARVPDRLSCVVLDLLAYSLCSALVRRFFMRKPCYEMCLDKTPFQMLFTNASMDGQEVIPILLKRCALSWSTSTSTETSEFLRQERSIAW